MSLLTLLSKSVAAVREVVLGEAFPGIGGRISWEPDRRQEKRERRRRILRDDDEVMAVINSFVEVVDNGIAGSLS